MTRLVLRVVAGLTNTCTSQCYTVGRDEGPECWCTGPKPCQTAITGGVCR